MESLEGWNIDTTFLINVGNVGLEELEELEEVEAEEEVGKGTLHSKEAYDHPSSGVTWIVKYPPPPSPPEVEVLERGLCGDPLPTTALAEYPQGSNPNESNMVSSAEKSLSIPNSVEIFWPIT